MDMMASETSSLLNYLMFIRQRGFSPIAFRQKIVRHDVHNSWQMVFVVTHKWWKQAFRGEPILAYQESSAEALIWLIPPSIVPFVLLYDKVQLISILSSSYFLFLSLWEILRFIHAEHIKKIQRLVTLLVVGNCMVLAPPESKDYRRW
jgi:hypothetical protein